MKEETIMYDYVPTSMLTNPEQQVYSLRSVVCQMCQMSGFRNRIIISEKGTPMYQTLEQMIIIPRSFLAKASSFCAALYPLLVQAKTGKGANSAEFQKEMANIAAAATLKLVNAVALS